MKIDNLRSFYRAKPFRPFSIVTGSGEAYLVPHPENIAFHSEGGVVIVIPAHGEVVMIDVESITEATYQFSTPPSTSLRCEIGCV